MQDQFLVGDVVGNTTRILEAAHSVKARGARLLVCPELAITAYPPSDLLLRNDFLAQSEVQLRRLLDQAPPTLGLIVGAPWRESTCLYNAAFYIEGGEIRSIYRKICLPNYSEFDEQRWFTAGSEPCVISVDDCRCALTICEDLWDKRVVDLYQPMQIDLCININASPFYIGKPAHRDNMLRARCQQLAAPCVYVNLVGGQDDLVFDGDSRFMSANGDSVYTAPAFTRGLYDCRLTAQRNWRHRHESPPTLSDNDYMWHALLTGLRDYCAGNHLDRVVLGLSGGIDSAVTLVLCVHALAAERVTAVMMRSRWTANISVEDAQRLAHCLGVHFYQLDIDKIKDQALNELAGLMKSDAQDQATAVALENIQARIRAHLLMTIANSRPGTALIATGNKSEFAVGYTTLYGDMAGAYAPLKDVTKSRVYKLARYCNRKGELIPQRIIERPPSAELAERQADQDTLPSYDVLDAIIEAFVERHESYEDIVRSGIAPAAEVRRILEQILSSEYKRCQAPPGTKITRRSFGREWRYPITSGFKPTSCQG